MEQRRIIDRDIESWTAFVECEEMQLRRCLPTDEPYWRDRLGASRRALQAMKDCRQAIDSLAQARRAFSQNPTPPLASSIKALVAAVRRGE